MRARSNSSPRLFNPDSLAGAPPDHGRHLRVRLARRRLAHPARVREAPPAAHGVRRRHGAATPSGGHRGLRRTGPRDRLPRLALDPLPAGRRGHRARAHAPGAWRRSRSSPASGRSAGTPGATAPTPAGWWSTWRLRVRQRLLRRRPSVLDEGAAQRRRRRAAPGRALHAGHRRHALRAAQGFAAGRGLLRLPARQPSTRSMPRATGVAQDDEHRHALPAARAAGPDRGAAALPGPRAQARPGWVCRRIDIARHWKQIHPFPG